MASFFENLDSVSKGLTNLYVGANLEGKGKEALRSPINVPVDTRVFANTSEELNRVVSEGRPLFNDELNISRAQPSPDPNWESNIAESEERFKRLTPEERNAVKESQATRALEYKEGPSDKEISSWPGRAGPFTGLESERRKALAEAQEKRRARTPRTSTQTGSPGYVPLGIYHPTKRYVPRRSPRGGYFLEEQKGPSVNISQGLAPGSRVSQTGRAQSIFNQVQAAQNPPRADGDYKLVTSNGTTRVFDPATGRSKVIDEPDPEPPETFTDSRGQVHQMVQDPKSGQWIAVPLVGPKGKVFADKPHKTDMGIIDPYTGKPIPGTENYIEQTTERYEVDDKGNRNIVTETTFVHPVTGETLKHKDKSGKDVEVKTRDVELAPANLQHKVETAEDGSIKVYAFDPQTGKNYVDDKLSNTLGNAFTRLQEELARKEDSRIEIAKGLDKIQREYDKFEATLEESVQIDKERREEKREEAGAEAERKRELNAITARAKAASDLINLIGKSDDPATIDSFSNFLYSWVQNGGDIKEFFNTLKEATQYKVFSEED